ncbi:jg13078 [Pararge aegeria aegeria]|uniref:Jg13078 protein n=1 Tax=Pararge aegeria aegeria TaxID=348720 RepID=A0A8S4S1K5_9NEOP|nr:jg13078 [Pararge aegeria aegeria]
MDVAHQVSESSHSSTMSLGGAGNLGGPQLRYILSVYMAKKNENNHLEMKHVLKLAPEILSAPTNPHSISAEGLCSKTLSPMREEPCAQQWDVKKA